MADQTARALALIENARHAEDVFGELPSDDAARFSAVKSRFRALALLVHPDTVVGDKARLENALTRLYVLWDDARDAIRQGTYGDRDRIDPVTIASKRGATKLTRAAGRDELSVSYRGTFATDGRERSALARVALSPNVNDLLVAEATALRTLRAPDGERFHPFLPELLDSFVVRARKKRRANVFAFEPDLCTLDDVRSAYPGGVDARDMAWMWRRLLFVLGYTHRAGIVHGAPLPENVLIHPEKHGLVLANWAYSTKGEPLRAVPRVQRAWYPQDALEREEASAGTDLYLAAQSMIWILGGDPTNGMLPAHVPKQIRAFFRGTRLANPKQRPDDAWALLADFTELIEKLYGPRKFRPFTIPRSGGAAATAT